jgi:hypothetical protein
VADILPDRPRRIKRSHEGSGFTHDEQHNRSMARLLLASTSLYIYGGIAVDTFTRFHIGAEAWVLLTTMESAFVIWTAGPRIAQYLAPFVAKAIESMADVIRKRRDPENGFEATP